MPLRLVDDSDEQRYNLGMLAPLVYHIAYWRGAATSRFVECLEKHETAQLSVASFAAHLEVREALLRATSFQLDEEHSMVSTPSVGRRSHH